MNLFRRLLCTLSLGVLLLAGSASATTFYAVAGTPTTTQNPGATGLSLLAPCNLDYANATADTGDVVILSPGDYIYGINPVHQGVRYRVSSAALVNVPGGSFNVDNIAVNGVTFTSGVTIGANVLNSVFTFCAFNGGLYDMGSNGSFSNITGQGEWIIEGQVLGQRCSASCTIKADSTRMTPVTTGAINSCVVGERIQLQGGGGGGYLATNPLPYVVSKQWSGASGTGNVIGVILDRPYNWGVATGTSTVQIAQFGGQYDDPAVPVNFYPSNNLFDTFSWVNVSTATGGNMFEAKLTHNLTLSNGTFNMTVNRPAGSDGQIFILYRSHYLHITNVNLNVVNNSSLSSNTKLAFTQRDSMVTPVYNNFNVKVSGTYGTSIALTNPGSYQVMLDPQFFNCSFQNDSHGGGSNSAAVSFLNGGKGVLLRDCRLIGLNGNCAISDGGFAINDSLSILNNTLVAFNSGVAYFVQDPLSGAFKMAGNAFYADGNPGCQNWEGGAAFRYFSDDGAVTASIDSNAYFVRGAAGSGADGCFKHGGYGCRALLFGNGAGSSWPTISGQDAHSVWLDPQFRDSSAASFDYTPSNPASVVSSKAGGLGYYGARSPVAPSTPTVTIVGNYLDPCNVTETFSISSPAPATGGLGPSSYQIYSTTSFPTSFVSGSATTYSATPGPPGTLTQFQLAGPSLNAGPRFTIVRAVDAWGRTSGYSIAIVVMPFCSN